MITAKESKNELAHMAEGLEMHQLDFAGKASPKFTRKLLKALVSKGFGFDPDEEAGARLEDVFTIVGSVQLNMGKKLNARYCRSIAKYLISNGLVKN